MNPDTAELPPTTDEVVLKVDGMTCASCAQAVQRTLESQDGVESAVVSLPLNRATISGHDVDAETLATVIKKSGYQATLFSDEQSIGELLSDIEQQHLRNTRQWRWRAVLGLSVWVPLESLHWIFRGHESMALQWVMFAGATAVILFVGWGFLRSAFLAALQRTTNMDTLITIGAGTAYVYSLVLFIQQLLGVHDGMGYFAEASGLLGLISLGHWLEARSSAKAGSAVRDLLSLQPDHATILDDDGTTRDVKSADLVPGDRVIIRPGDAVPVDGTVIEGHSEVDEAIVTGESRLIEKQQGDAVVAAAINTTGRLVIEANVDGRHTTVARIAELVSEAQASKADIQRIADRVSSVFVPAVLGIAVLTIVIWWSFGYWSTGVIAAVTVMIISCPCALGLATPMAVMVGAGSASKRGILIKSAGALEVAGRSKRIIFDKTGTLTKGQAEVTAITPTDSQMSADELLEIAAKAESASEHPIGEAIVTAARKRGLTVSQPDEFKSTSGQGVWARFGDQEIIVRRDPEATCQVLVNDKIKGTITLEDQPREDAAEAIRALESLDISVHMLTGDRQSAAERIAAQIGIKPENITADVTPEEKHAFIQANANGAVMVGDGINDAAALATADLGIAMASGTNIAIESANVVIPNDRVLAVPETIVIARKSLRTIHQNLFFAFIYNTCAIPIAAVGLMAEYGPMIAALAMGLSDVCVIGNALRLQARLRRDRPLLPEIPARSQ